MMKNEEVAVWGIHAGRNGEADSLFLKYDCVALGWPKVGNLSKIRAEREDFKNKIIENYPEKKAGAIPNNAGQLFRFVHEMKKNDLIVYPSKIDKNIHIGRINSQYEFADKPDPIYPHHRQVIWLKSIPRTRFSQGALYEIGSAMSFFQIRNYGDEFRQAIDEKKRLPEIQDDSEAVARISEDIETNTRVFIIKRLSRLLKGHPFAEFIAHLLGTMGYRTRLSPEGTDGGVDIIAHKDELGFEPPIIKVQVKSSEDTIGDPVVSSLYGKVTEKEFGMFITLGKYSPHAKNFERNKTNLRLIDGEELVSLILQHYEQFDSQYKSILPLKKLYVPEALGEEEE